jgi:hypothetical protein
MTGTERPQLPPRDVQTGTRWTVVWDTNRGVEGDGRNRNIAVEKVEADAFDSARHLLRMGFIVYEIRDPSGSIFLSEAELRTWFGLQPDPQESPRILLAASENANVIGVEHDDMALAMAEMHRDRAGDVALGNARAALTARQMMAAKNWLHVVELIRQRKSPPVEHLRQLDGAASDGDLPPRQ